MAEFVAASWGRDVDETFQELTLEEVCDVIASVRKKRGPRKMVVSIWLSGTLVEIEVRRIDRAKVPI